jgi:hypothetical protein
MLDTGVSNFKKAFILFRKHPDKTPADTVVNSFKGRADEFLKIYFSGKNQGLRKQLSLGLNSGRLDFIDDINSVGSRCNTRLKPDRRAESRRVPLLSGTPCPQA